MPGSAEGRRTGSGEISIWCKTSNYGDFYLKIREKKCVTKENNKYQCGLDEVSEGRQQLTKKLKSLHKLRLDKIWFEAISQSQAPLTAPEQNLAQTAAVSVIFAYLWYTFTEI